MTDFSTARRNMVDCQVRPSDVTDIRIIDAMLALPREAFVPEEQRALTYLDLDLDVSQKGPTKRYLIKPMVIAKMIQAAHNIKVSPAMVSTVLSQDRTRGGKPAKRGRPPKAAGGRGRKAGAAATGGGVSVDTLVRIKQLADEMGGVDQARKALDALSQILG